MGQVQAEELTGNVLEILDVATSFDVTGKSLVDKLTLHFHDRVRNYYIMFRFVKTGQTGDRPGGPVEARTSITYYELKKPHPFLAVVRYTAYGVDGLALKVCEDIYEDDPDEFCRLETDVEVALTNGIDASIMSEYEHDVFPCISSFLS